MNQIHVYRGRTTIITASLGYDLTNETFASEIRVDRDRNSDLIATWNVEFSTDGSDGELKLTLDNSIADDITETRGFMDIKRINGGEPMNVFDEPIEVLIHEPVTA